MYNILTFQYREHVELEKGNHVELEKEEICRIRKS